jgi:cephalosporin hydroxylase
VSVNNYCIVRDTVIENAPAGYYWDRPWDKGSSPKTAVWEFLKDNDNFIIDKNIQNKLLITVASDGYLRRVK